MPEGRYGLKFYGVPLLHRPVEKAGSVYYLDPAGVSPLPYVHVAQQNSLGCERIGCDLGAGGRQVRNKQALSHIRSPGDHHNRCGCIYVRERTHGISYPVQKVQFRVHSLDYRGYSAIGGLSYPDYLRNILGHLDLPHGPSGYLMYESEGPFEVLQRAVHLFDAPKRGIHEFPVKRLHILRFRKGADVLGKGALNDVAHGIQFGYGKISLVPHLISVADLDLCGAAHGLVEQFRCRKHRGNFVIHNAPIPLQFIKLPQHFHPPPL